NLFDVRQMPVFLLLLVRDRELRSGDTFTFRLFDAACRAQVQTRKRHLDRAPVRTRVKQGADGHIAADTGKCVKIADFQALFTSVLSARWTATSASSTLVASAVRWPILRPGRGLVLPYRCSLTFGIAVAAAQSGSPFDQISPNKFAMAAGEHWVTSPNGSPHTERNCCSNWLVTLASNVKWPELCGLG